MRYFILLPGDTEESVDFSTNILGEVSFKNFWADQGFGILARLVEKYPDTLEEAPTVCQSVRFRVPIAKAYLRLHHPPIDPPDTHS